jgi:antirestriction protein
MSEREPTFEAARPPTPRVYVASLSDYNAGRLHGAWIEVDQDDEVIAAEIADVMATSPEPHAEEWAVHDYEGFGPLRVPEYISVGSLARIGRGIAENGLAFAGWLSCRGLDDDLNESFEEHCRGQWPSLTAYVEELLDDLGVDPAAPAPDWLRPYVSVDVDGLARDMASDLEVVEAPDGSVWLFDP